MAILSALSSFKRILLLSFQVGCLASPLLAVPALPQDPKPLPPKSEAPKAKPADPIPQTAPSVPAPQTKTATPQPHTPRFIILLDAAHGGDDGGAKLGGAQSGQSGIVAEKTLTLELSVRLRSLLAARGFTVLTTREGNVNLDDTARAQIANHAGAAACLSLHASETGSGVHIFVSSLSPTPPMRFQAWKTAQSAYVARSLKLASTVNSGFGHSSLAGATDSGGSDSGPIPATLARTSLPVIDSMACPALAVEFSPIRDSDRAIAIDITDQQYKSQIIDTLAAAMLEWRTDWESDLHPAGHQP